MRPRDRLPHAISTIRKYAVPFLSHTKFEPGRFHYGHKFIKVGVGRSIRNIGQSLIKVSQCLLPHATALVLRLVP